MKDGEVIIVDEFTGRYARAALVSDGLHQAVEAKENVKIEQREQTLATITFQNYFRMYDKLAGMTGTAETEAAEFQQIYNLDGRHLPTNRADGPRGLPRPDLPDGEGEVQRRGPGDQGTACEGRPVLVGTISIENPSGSPSFSQREASSTRC